MLDFNNREEVAKKLQELKEKKLPHLTIESFTKVDNQFKNNIQFASDEEMDVIKEYLSQFYDDLDKQGADRVCVFSEKQPNLSWGLVHGTAIDHNTGLDWRGYHYLTIDGKKERYTCFLQYHPDNYTIEEEESNDEA